ncbi:MAG: SBBP repeat-containing protein [Chlorobi bacterium]|nr:SBBP repeat-containing protein [Chlorobiota bacterium]MCI0715106.1 SBBP repeat-containing protein [Chlorobiota bacterium]
MKAYFLLMMVLLCGVGSAQSQWVSNYVGDSGGDINFSSAKGNAIAVDNSGNSYVTGYCYEIFSGNDIITIKYNEFGDTLWVRSYNGSSSNNDEGKGICTDSYGNVYVVGSSQNTGKGNDITILKYSSDGTLIWDRPFSSSEANREDKGIAIAVDGNDYIYVTGYTTGDDYKQDIVTIKYDQSGIVVWSSLESGNEGLNSQGLCLAISNSGSVYVTGFVAASSTGADIALVKYNSEGILQWVKYVNGGGNSEDKAWGIVVDQSDNVYITGYVTEANYNIDCYTAKYSSDGALLWSRTYNGNGNNSDKSWGIVVDTDGSVYITGESKSSNINYLTVKYDYAGNQIWASTYNGSGNGTDIASAIGIITNPDNTKSVVVTGKSWGYWNYDFATVRYNSITGEQTQANRYSMNGITNDVAKDLAVSENNNVYITGYSQLLVESSTEQSYVSTMMLNWGAGSELITNNNNTPQKFELGQNYPNPFNPSTTIKFVLPYPTEVKLVVYDMLGKVVDVLVNQELNAGSYNITFSNNSLASGIYFYKLTAGEFTQIKKMTLVK